MTVKERLILFLKANKISNRAFSLSIGMSENYVTNIRKSIQPNVINNIAINYPQLNTGWLLTGEGEMLKNDSTDIEISKKNTNMETQKNLEEMNELLKENNVLLKQIAELKDKVKFLEDELRELGKDQDRNIAI